MPLHLPGRALAPLALLLALACSSETPFDPGQDSGRAPDFDTGLFDDAGAGSDANASGQDGATSSADGTAGDTGIDPRDPNNLRRDTDCDGLSDAFEIATVYPDGSKTSPIDPDSDHDGIPDGTEVGTSQPVTGASCPSTPTDADPSSRTSPTRADSDGDGISDGVEDRDHNGRADSGETDPRLRDSDRDGIPDGIEDANHNGARDAGETAATSPDSDGDGIADGLEDANRDGVRDSNETDPLATDSDGDGVLDGDEDTDHDGTRQPWESDPRTTDTDCDGISDGEELAGSTSPLVADSDRDGLSDGVESGRTMPVAGSSCPGFVADADPGTTTSPTNPDSDGDGVPDGVEDANHNGRVDAGEPNPALTDSDGDGFPDGDEVAAGTNPADGTSPGGALGDGIRAICSDANLQPITFSAGAPGAWTLASEPSLAYASLTSANAQVRAATLDGATSGIAAFVLEMPIASASPATAVGQTSAIITRVGANAGGQSLTVTQRQSGRAIRSHDGFEATVSAVFDVTAATAINAAEARNRLLALVSGLAVTNFGNLPTNTGAAVTTYAMTMQVLVRPAAGVVIVVAGALDRARFDDGADTRGIQLADLTNGTALAEPSARRGKGCDPFQATGDSVADFVWMADISASTDDDRGRIVSAAQLVFDALTNNNVDFRMAVVPHSQSTIHQPANAGNLRGTGFTRSRTDFGAYLQDVSGTDGCEFGVDAVSAAISRALPRSPAGQEDAHKIRSEATLAVVYVSDENAQEVEEGPCFNMPRARGCPTMIGDGQEPNGTVASCSVTPAPAQQACVDQILQPYINQLRNEGAIAFGQVFNPTPAVACNTGHFVCPNSAQLRNEPGRGYVEVINATGGIFYSPCEANPGQGSLQAIVDAVTGAASQYQLRGAPISASLKLGITHVGAGGMTTTTVVPRHRQNGFDYDPVSNAVFFHGTTYRPAVGDRVTISYRVWQPPLDPCGGPCPPGQVCDPMLQVCACDQADCATRCGPNGTCAADCSCTCTPDCNGRCGPGQVCNQNTCQCDCAPDCGGCPTGTACNPSTCACDCTSDCGGACGAAGPNLTCDGAACACTCPTDCGGACGSARACNPSTCACECPADCDAQCSGNARCDIALGCACACPTDCGGCPDGTTCDPQSCQCSCSSACDQNCPNRQVCDPNSNCGCVCPVDCGGCEANETCDPSSCRCVPIV